jgi:hypothetical protein
MDRDAGRNEYNYMENRVVVSISTLAFRRYASDMAVDVDV